MYVENDDEAGSNRVSPRETTRVVRTDQLKSSQTERPRMLLPEKAAFARRNELILRAD